MSLALPTQTSPRAGPGHQTLPRPDQRPRHLRTVSTGTRIPGPRLGQQRSHALLTALPIFRLRRGRGIAEFAQPSPL